MLIKNLISLVMLVVQSSFIKKVEVHVLCTFTRVDEINVESEA